MMLLINIIIISGYIITGCTSNLKNSEGFEDGGVTIVTSFYPMYLHVINITKDIHNIQVINMAQPQTGCLHDYQLTPNDLKTLDGADIFVVNGGGMEGFLDKSLSQLTAMDIIDASKNIELMENHDHGDNDDHEGHEHDVNPHIWVSVTGAIEQVKAIAEELGNLDQAHKKEYKANANVYIEKLEQLRQEMHGILDHVPNKNIVTFHEAFPYFAKEFELNIIGTIVTEPGSEPSAKILAKIIEDIKKYDVKAVFVEPQYDSKAADVISKEANVQLYTLDPIVTGIADEDQKDQYLIVMRENLKTLEEALQ